MTLTPLLDGTISLTSTGVVGVAYSIQAATNLGGVWTTLVTAGADSNGLVNFVDQGGTNYPSRFYRSLQFSTALFDRGLTAKGKISLSGGGFLDSYNSSVGSYSSTNRGANAVALSNTNAAGAINLSSGKIYGMAVTSPGGTVTTSSSGSVGDTDWVGSHTGVQPGHVADNANYQFNDIAPPSFPAYFTSFTQSGTTNIAGTAGTTSYYIVSGISEPAGMTLVINGNVAIYCTRTGNYSVNVSGSGQIVITPGSSLTIYSAGNVIISGIINESGLASSCLVYGLPTCTTFTYSGAANFVGVVDAPEANFIFTGSASTCGAFIANSFTASNTGGIHYDEALGGN
jgi:hypothetical protein